MVQCLIGLGSNMNDREAAIVAAWQAVGKLPGTRTLRLSRSFTTEPAGGPGGQEVFSNAVGVVETELPPETLLSQLLATETALGRIREVRWGPRSIDLDLLLHGGSIVQSPSLVLPHPGMAFRRFVLEPAAEVARDFVYPINGWMIGQLLDHLNQTKRLIAFASTDPQLQIAALREVLSRSPSCGIQQGDASVLQSTDSGNRWTLLDNWPQETAIEEPSRTAAEPKLVVLLDPARTDDPVAALRRDYWRRRIRQRDVGPVLWLTCADAAEVADEVIAAMSAMG